MHNEKKTKRNK